MMPAGESAAAPEQGGSAAAPTPDPGLALDCLESLRLGIGREPDAANNYERYLVLATAVVAVRWMPGSAPRPSSARAKRSACTTCRSSS